MKYFKPEEFKLFINEYSLLVAIVSGCVKRFVSTISHKYKVLYFIVRFTMVNVMSLFVFIENSAKVFFHNNAVFRYISLFGGKGMVGKE